MIIIHTTHIKSPIKFLLNALFSIRSFFTSKIKIFIIYFYLFIDQFLLKNKNDFTYPYTNSRKKMLIIGMGTKLNFKKLFSIKKNYCLMTVNKFFLSKEANKIILDYYIIIHRPQDQGWNSNELHTKLKFYIQKNKATSFYLSSEWKKKIGVVDNVTYFNMSILQIIHFNQKWLKHKNIFPSFSNIVIAGVFIALKMGFKHIHVSGHNLLFGIWKNYNYFEYDNRLLMKDSSLFNENIFKVANLMLEEWIFLKKLSENIGACITMDLNDSFVPLFKSQKINSNI